MATNCLCPPSAAGAGGISLMRGIYPAFLDGKLWLKLHTPLGRFARLSALELEEEPLQTAESVRS